jgi:DNA-binding beta-propeller fold protein YncE
MKLLPLILLLSAAALLVSQPAPRERVGPLASGGFLLNSGWRLRPAGNQVPVGTLPMSSALSPDGKFLLVLNGGYNPPSISILDVASEKEVGRAPVEDGWLGLTFSPKGDFVYVGGGSRADVVRFKYSNGALTERRSFPVVPAAKRTVKDFIGDVALSPDGRLIYAADLFHDSVVVINPQSGMLIERFKTGRRPYRILFHPDGKSFFVTSWTDGSLGQYQADNGALLATVRLAPHPTDMVWVSGKVESSDGEAQPTARLFVAAANTNNVYSVGVNAGNDLRVLETINVAMTPRHPLGMTPSALAVSPDSKRLYVVCSDANAVAVADISQERADVMGFIPTGWYPTAARAITNQKLAILSGRGLQSYPNPKGPNPSQKAAPRHEGIIAEEYVGKLQTGTVAFLPAPSDEQLDAYSKTVLDNSPYNDNKLDDAGIPPGGPIPSKPGERSPIQHVIYIVKENRTYDQVLGDMKEGNGDASLVLFGDRITPNQHKLAREFVLLDNFYVNSDVSADGHNWSTAAIASDYVQKMWPNSYAGRRRGGYDYEGQEPTAGPGAGYLWTNAAARKISMRNYGYFVNNTATPAGEDGVQIEGVRDPILNRVTNPRYRGFDLNYTDVDRVKVLLKELAEFEKSGQMPSLMFVRLGNDHTSGTAAGKISPLSAAADNDFALGMLVEGVSRSRFWSSTAIFVLEDDAQNGPDHVDSHRSPAYLISPYVKHGAVDGTLYNTTSMLRTMELILGLNPMTHFDAGARPMNAAFQSTPAAAPYTAEKPRIPLDQRNPEKSATAARSARMDFSEEDRIDDDELNDILWIALRGTTPPAPVRSYFAR